MAQSVQASPILAAFAQLQQQGNIRNQEVLEERRRRNAAQAARFRAIGGTVGAVAGGFFGGAPGAAAGGLAGSEVGGAFAKEDSPPPNRDVQAAGTIANVFAQQQQAQQAAETRRGQNVQLDALSAQQPANAPISQVEDPGAQPGTQQGRATLGILQATRESQDPNRIENAIQLQQLLRLGQGQAGGQRLPDKPQSRPVVRGGKRGTAFFGRDAEGQFTREIPGSFTADASAKKGGGVREQKISDATKPVAEGGLGMGRTDAIKLVDGIKRVVVTPNGITKIVDDQNLTVAEPNPAGGRPVDATGKTAQEGLRAAANPTPPAPKISLWKIAAAGNIAGVEPMFADWWARTGGQAGFPIDEAVQSGQTALNAELEMVAKAFAKDERFSVRQKEQFKKALNISPRAFDSTPALLARMRQVDNFISAEIDNAQRAAANSQLSDRDRAGAAATAEALQNFRTVLDVPQNGGAQPAPGTAVAAEPATASPRTQAEFDALPSGATYIDPNDPERKLRRKP